MAVLERALPARAAAQYDRAALALSAKAFLGSRAIVWVAGSISLALFGENVNAAGSLDPQGLTAPFTSIPFDKLVAPMGRWDSVSYLTIAHGGYQNPLSTVFYPLYPLLIRIGSILPIPPLLVAGLLSSLLAVAALALLHRVALLDLDEPAATLTVLLVAFFPTSLFLSAAYTESLLLLLTLAAVYGARTERWWLAGLAGGLAALTHSNGVLILVPVAILYLYGPRAAAPTRPGGGLRPRYRLRADAAWFLLVPLGLLAYLGYLGLTHDAPFQPFISEQKYYQHWFAGPFGALVVAFLHLPRDVSLVLQGRGSLVGTGDPLSWSAHELIDLCFGLLALAALAAGWRHLPRAYWVYAFVSLAFLLSVPTIHEPMSAFSRYMLPVFPLFMGAAAAIAGKRKFTVSWLLVSCLALTLLSGLWGLWDYVA